MRIRYTRRTYHFGIVALFFVECRKERLKTKKKKQKKKRTTAPFPPSDFTTIFIVVTKIGRDRAERGKRRKSSARESADPGTDPPTDKTDFRRVHLPSPSPRRPSVILLPPAYLRSHRTPVTGKSTKAPLRQHASPLCQHSHYVSANSKPLLYLFRVYDILYFTFFNYFFFSFRLILKTCRVFLSQPFSAKTISYPLHYPLP